MIFIIIPSFLILPEEFTRATLTLQQIIRLPRSGILRTKVLPKMIGGQGSWHERLMKTLLMGGGPFVWRREMYETKQNLEKSNKSDSQTGQRWRSFLSLPRKTETGWFFAVPVVHDSSDAACVKPTQRELASDQHYDAGLQTSIMIVIYYDPSYQHQYESCNMNEIMMIIVSLLCFVHPWDG